MIFSNDKCCMYSKDIEIYLSAVFLYLAVALPHHNTRGGFVTPLQKDNKSGRREP